MTLVTVAFVWGCERKQTEVASSLDNQGPCPAEDSLIPYDRPPEITFFVPPPYPDSSRQLEHEGTVGLHVLVGRKGGAVDAIVRQSCGWRELDQFAREYAFKNAYRPGEFNGRAVCMWMVYHVTFNLPEEEDST